MGSEASGDVDQFELFHATALNLERFHQVFANARGFGAETNH